MEKPYTIRVEFSHDPVCVQQHRDASIPYDDQRIIEPVIVKVTAVTDAFARTRCAFDPGIPAEADGMLRRYFAITPDSEREL